MEELTSSPKILDQPDKPTISDIRLPSQSNDHSLTIKIIEQRVFEKLISEESEGDFRVKKYERVRERAVNVAKLNKDGVLELRIASHSNSTDYRNDLKKFWLQIAPFFPQKQFNTFPLSKAKTSIWENRDKLTDILMFSEFIFRNEDGIALKMTTGSDETNLMESKGAVSSIDEFVDDDGHCERLNIWFLPYNGSPSKKIHVILTREYNEFAITANCTEPDYEYVLKKLREFNS